MSYLCVCARVLNQQRYFRCHLSHQQKCQILARNPKYPEDSDESNTNQTRHSMVAKTNDWTKNKKLVVNQKNPNLVP